MQGILEGVVNNWGGQNLRHKCLHRLTRCCSIHLAPKYHCIVASPSLSFHFTLLALLPILALLALATLCMLIPVWITMRLLVSTAAVLGTINLRKLCKQFAFLSVTNVCIPKFFILTCWDQSGLNSCVSRHWISNVVKYTPPPTFAHHFEAEVGRGCFLDYSISLVHTPLSPHNVTCKSTITTSVAKYGSFTECIREISSACVDTNLRGIKATCIVSDERGWPSIKS